MIVFIIRNPILNIYIKLHKIKIYNINIIELLRI